MSTPRKPLTVPSTPVTDPRDRTAFLDLPPDPPENERTFGPVPDVDAFNGKHALPAQTTVGGEGAIDPTSTPLVHLIQQINIAWVAKTLVHLLGPALTLLATATVFSPLIAAQVAVAILGAIPVYFITKSYYLKAVCSALVVVAQGVLAWFGPSWHLVAHPTWQSWVALAVSALTAAGVLVIPNGVKFSYHLTR